MLFSVVNEIMALRFADIASGLPSRSLRERQLQNVALLEEFLLLKLPCEDESRSITENPAKTLINKNIL